MLSKTNTTSYIRSSSIVPEKENSLVSSNINRWIEENKKKTLITRLKKQKSQCIDQNETPADEYHLKCLKNRNRIFNDNRKSTEIDGIIETNPEKLKIIKKISEGTKLNDASFKIYTKENKILDVSKQNSRNSSNISTTLSNNESFNHQNNKSNSSFLLIPQNEIYSKCTSNEAFQYDNLNKNLINYYGKDILEILRAKELTIPKTFLDCHQISANLRSRMVDWMVEVLSSYKCQDQTFFMSVCLMDNYFRNAKISYDVNEMHLVGVTCMFIASKYEEIYPFKLKLVYEKIAHKKISIEKIKKKEKEILEALDYNLSMPSCYEFLTAAIQMIFINKEITKKTKTYLEQVCIYLLKMSLHDYDIITKQNQHILAASCILVGFKIIEQIDKKFSSEKMIKNIKSIFDLDDDLLYESSTKILNLAKNFEKLYPNLENLKKFNGFSITQDGKTQRK